MRNIFLLLLALSSHSLYAQKSVADTTANRIIAQCEATFPKFYREFQNIKSKDTLIKKFVFIDQPSAGPASALPNGIIRINLDFLKVRKPAFDDNRLIVVLYHEIGHLHYFSTVDRKLWNPIASEQAAFEYSLLKTKEMAEDKDCLPLQTGLKFMKLRSEGNDLKDPHVLALKRMVNEPLYAAYIEYVTGHCN
jgi:hypothetical protein